MHFGDSRKIHDAIVKIIKGESLLCISQFQLHPVPPGYCGAFARLVSPGGGAFANFVLPGGQAFANPRDIP